MVILPFVEEYRLQSASLKWHLLPPAWKILLYLNKMSGVTMKSGLDEYGELKVMRDFHSVFNAARFALSQYVSTPTDYPIAYADRVGVATC